MKTLIFVLVIFNGLVVRSQETFVITGTVKDAKGSFVTGATIYLSGSTKITATNEKGEFRIGSLPSGTYEVVVKMLGFDPHSQTVILQQKSMDISIELKESSIALNAVVIKGKSDPNRAEYLKLFTDIFIGKSDNASRCRMLNPDVLNLRYNATTDVLVVSADEALSIENQGLGYKLNYLITSFKVDFKNRIFSYEGSSYFEELPASASEKKQWEQNRKKAYEGSIRHFFRAAFNNSAESEGFLAYQLPDRQILNQLSKKELLTIEPVNIASLFTADINGFKLLKLKPDAENNNSLYVIYTKDKEQPGFYISGGHLNFQLKLPSGENQISLLHPLADNIKVEKNGSLTPAKSFSYDGYWSWERIADLMPIDYADDASKITTPVAR